MINSDRELSTSISSICINYLPDNSKPINVKCEKLGRLFLCKNHKGDKEGCLFCEKFIKKERGITIANIDEVDS